MPDQTVKVAFSPPSNWSFDKNPAHMSAAGKIILHRDPGSAAWTFVSVNGLPGGFTSNLQGNGSQITIQDPFTPPYNTPIPYTITVALNGTNYTSPLQGSAQAAGGPPVARMSAGASATQLAAGPPPIIMNDGTTAAQ